MSYARFGKDSDVYLIKHVDGGWRCYCNSNTKLDSLEDVEAHLMNHQLRGDKVPKCTLERVREEMVRGDEPEWLDDWLK